MKQKLIFIGKILLFGFIVFSLWVTWYFYFYQGFFADTNIEDKEVTAVETKVITENKVEDVILLRELISQDTEAGKKLYKALEWGTNGELDIAIQVKKSKILNEIFNYDVFDEAKEQAFNINIKNKSWIGSFVLNSKINGRTAHAVGKYDPSYIYLDSAVLNGLFAMMDAKSLDYFLDSLGGYIDYKSFQYKKISFVPLVWLDGYIGKSQQDYYASIINSLLKLFECKKDVCSLILNIDSIDKIKEILDNSQYLTEKQKQAILGLSIRTIDYISGSSVSIKNNGIELSLQGEVDLNFRVIYTSKNVETKINTQSYEQKSMEELIADFQKRNPLFTSVLTNNDIVINTLLE